ncbi:hypothetical protein ACMCNP_05250 [Candidatus Acidulodesulfobacterium sp. H_13]|uniref:hypothetical protein n=1 Tax=Candidatus Acidulodesulfobacterium sp. H_13 TaxID=3395470 RepID=UPI003AF957F6
MRKNFLALALFVFAIAGFLALAATSPSFAASQANKAGVSFSLSGQYVGKLLWAQNQAQVFSNSSKSATRNTFQTLLQRVRLNSKISYDKLSHGMPLAMLAVQVDLTNAYNGVTNGLGSNGWYALGGTPAPLGFDHDFNTFGLRLAYLRVITPIGAIMVGRMPVKFGLGIAVNTDADGLGDFMPIGNIGIFAGVLFGSEVSTYNAPQGKSKGGNNVYNVGIYPPTGEGYTHMQVGTIPVIEVMTLKPINNISYSAWLSEAHLNQFKAQLSYITKISGVKVYSPTSTISSYYPTANITFGGLSATYSKAGTKLAGEVDYFQGRIIASNQAIDTGLPLSRFLPVSPSGSDQYDAVNAYDLYLTGSKMLSTPVFPVSVGFKFGIGAPIAIGHYNFTYYSQIQHTRTLFGNVIGSNWQAIQIKAPGESYIYGPPLGTNLANKYGIMADAQEFLPSGNTLQESLIYAAWLQDSLNGAQEFGGKAIGTEFDINFTHHFTKTLAWQAWGGYVWTGNGVESETSTSAKPFAGAEHKDITALGSAFIWNF